MSEVKLAIFDDARGRWGPLTDRRAVFDLRTGAHTTLQRLERGLGRAAAVFVPAPLAAVTSERHATRDAPIDVNLTSLEGNWLLVNGRWPGGDVALAQRIAALPRGAAMLQADGTPVAAHLDASAAGQWVETHFAELPGGVEHQTLERDVLLARPWHVLDALETMLRADLEACELPDWRARPAGEGADPNVRFVDAYPLRIAPDATVQPMVVFGNMQGPIVVDRGARIDPFTVLEGPCYIGAHAHIAPQTTVRAGTSVGPHCKVGGEIKHTVIQGNTNKAHLGYLGDSIVGEWVNLGADTNVSNLKNTYGRVRIALEPEGSAEDTGRVNHGPIIGDFVRTAIGTRLLTGGVVGTGCMLAVSDFAPRHARPFTFCTDAGTVVHELDALLATVRRMMERRGVELTAAEAELLRRLHTRSVARVA